MRAPYRFNRVATPADDIEAGEIETVTEDGTEYYVIPVVASREQVYSYRTNAGMQVAEYLPADELEDAVPNENGSLTTVVDHPVNDRGEFVPVDSPDATNVAEVGEFRDMRANTDDDGRTVMTGDVWIPTSNVGGFGGALSSVVDQIESGEPVEVSIGYDPDVVNQAGRFNGEEYDRVQTNIELDHLAILPHEEGNCSVENGCGLGREPITANSSPEDAPLSVRVRSELRSILLGEGEGSATGRVTALRSNTQIGADSGSCGCGGHDADSCECDHGGADGDDADNTHHANANGGDGENADPTGTGSNGGPTDDGESDSDATPDSGDSGTGNDGDSDSDSDTKPMNYEELAEQTPFSADELRDMNDDRVEYLQTTTDPADGGADDGGSDDGGDDDGTGDGDTPAPADADDTGHVDGQVSTPDNVVTTDEFESLRETVEEMSEAVQTAVVEPQEQEKEQAAETITANTSVSRETVMDMSVDEAKALARDVSDDPAPESTPPNMAAAPSQDGAVRANSAQSDEDADEYPAPGISNWSDANGDD